MERVKEGAWREGRKEHGEGRKEHGESEGRSTERGKEGVRRE